MKYYWRVECRGSKLQASLLWDLDYMRTAEINKSVEDIKEYELFNNYIYSYI